MTKERRDVGVYRWLRAGGVLGIPAIFYWFLGMEGIIAGICYSIAFLFTSNTIRSLYCRVSVYPGGIHAYNRCQDYLKKYTSSGSTFHKVIRTYWLRKLFYFVHSENCSNYSWRPFAIIAALAVLLYWNLLIGIACLVMLLSIFIVLADSLSVPVGIYLGNSSEASHNMLARIRAISGFKWASLLHDLNPAPKSATEPDAIAGSILTMMDTNLWSLRLDDESNWMEVVEDFIQAAAIIIVRPELLGPVREEIDILSKTDFIHRIIIINTDSDIIKQLPERLHRCVLDEEDAMSLIALTASKPRLFIKSMQAQVEANIY